MGLFNWLRKPREERSESYSSALDCFAPIGLSDTGEAVNPETAMAATGVYAAVSIIARSIMSLPVHVINEEKTQRLFDHRLTRLFTMPNEFMSWPDLMEAYCVNLLTTGNAYAWVERDKYFDPVAIYPLKSLRTYPRRENGRLDYVTTEAGGAASLPVESVIHTRNISDDGICGKSPIRCGANAIGLALALDKFAARFFSNGASISGLLTLPPMKPEALAEFKRRWEAQYQGSKNSHRIAMAPDVKFQQVSFSPHDSQAVESRRFQLLELCRIYQIPPHKLADLERATFSNIEEQTRDFAENTIRPWVIKIEAALERTLLREDERGRIKIRLNLGAIIRGSLKDQIDAVTKATGGAPVYTQNEGREFLGLRPIKGGDVLLQNLNQAPADKRTPALLRSIAANLTTKEANAVRRAAKQHAADADGFATWAIEFYRSHIETLARALDGTGITSDTLLEHCQQEGRATATAFANGKIEDRIQAIKTTGAEQLAKRLGLALFPLSPGECNHES